MNLKVAEKFKSVQGEGMYCGVPMAFIRLVGCTVGKKICHHCDTDFDDMYSWRGGGEFSPLQLVEWVKPYRHVCLTGGEPLAQDVRELLKECSIWSMDVHVETSGTISPIWLQKYGAMWAVEYGDGAFVSPMSATASYASNLHICVSPKPGYINSFVLDADEIKVIVPGLGNGEGWPNLDDALRWASMGRNVYLQPRNKKFDVDYNNLVLVQDIVREYPSVRLSAQLHKILRVQ